MFGYSMDIFVRRYAKKLDLNLRDSLLNLYKTYQWAPPAMHPELENNLKKLKKYSVILEFNEDSDYRNVIRQCEDVCKRHFRTSVKQMYPSYSGCHMEITPNALEDLLSSSTAIKKVYQDYVVQAFLDNAVPSIRGKRIVRRNKILSGDGVTIAVLDSGIYPHQDLQGRIIAFKDFVNGRTMPYDDNGHGTHCAGDAAGNGKLSSGRYRGPAWKANVIGVKVLDREGSGYTSNVIAGIDWCIQYNQQNPGRRINVISLSLGSPAPRFPSENDDPMVRSVEAAWNNGIVVCVAAGNQGPQLRTISTPGVSNQVITVGAMDDRNNRDRSDEGIAYFSSRGPTEYGVPKPDVVAPGVSIISLRAPNSYMDIAQPGNRVGQQYFAMSGTSMATPIVAGVVALMLEHTRTLTPNQVKQRLIAGAEPWGPINIYGKGYIDASKSIPNP